MEKKQVSKSHYNFDHYMHKRRWISIWHQIDETFKTNPKNVLEVGPGLGLFKLIISFYGISIETVDIDKELNPDHIAPAENLPFDNNAYDCVCAFQLLEHIPYNNALIAFKELVRVSKKHIIISLPDAKKIWRYSLYIPKFGQQEIHLSKPNLFRQIHEFDGQHHWEINKKKYSLKKIISDFSQNNIEVIKEFRVNENPYHRFFVFKKKQESTE